MIKNYPEDTINTYIHTHIYIYGNDDNKDPINK